MRKISGRLVASYILMLVAACAVAAQAQTYSLLYTFTGGADGSSPNVGLIADSAGNLYGTTAAGGNFNSTCISPINTCGVVFRLDPTGAETVLHSFSETDGSAPLAGLVADGAGNLYGTTYVGGNTNCNGSRGCGVIFRLNSAGSETVVHNFLRTDGKFPRAGIIRDSEGNLYGAASGGGMTGTCSPYGCGVVFKLDPTRQEYTLLYRFTGRADGGIPAGNLIRDVAGNLYGTGEVGGTSNASAGVIFKIDPLGNETVLYSFTGGADGGTPLGGLVRDAAGNLFGTTIFGGNTGTCPGGSLGCGVVFKVSPSGEETVLHTFTGGADGWSPYSSLIRDTAGNLYGTTEYGGNSSSSCPTLSWGCGVVFKLAPSGEQTVLYAFTGGADGYEPLAALFLMQGSLYGTTSYGGSFNAGVVYKIALK